MTDKTTDALAEARASVALDKGETETRCVDDFGVESVTHGGLEDPNIATLRRYVRRAGSHGGVSAEQAMADDDAIAAIDALASKLAERDRQIVKLAGLAYVPGLRRCAKCGLRAQLRNLGVADGRVTDDNSPHDCPNGCGPMWRVTNEEDRSRLLDEAELRALEAPPELETRNPARGGRR